MKKLTASVVGGGAGGKLSLKALADSELFEATALADLRPEVGEELRQKFPGLQTFTDYREMFQKCPTDIVCVSTYPPSHEEVTMEALKNPLKGILVEKPLAHTAASGLRILEAVKAKRIPMATPHGLMAKQCPLEIIERVRRGEIGEVKLVEIQSPKWDIINAGIHWLNFSLVLLNQKVTSVLAAIDKSTRTYRDGMQVETEGVTYVKLAGGARIVMQTGDYVQRNARKDLGDKDSATFRIIGTTGLIEFWGWEPDYYLINATHPNGELFTPAEKGSVGHRRHLENLVPMIESGNFDYTIPETSQSALEICESAYLSGKYGVEVKFPMQNFQPPAANDWEPGQPYSNQPGGRDGRKL
jgi:predicted dehydrogenase